MFLDRRAMLLVFSAMVVLLVSCQKTPTVDLKSSGGTGPVLKPGPSQSGSDGSRGEEPGGGAGDGSTAGEPQPSSTGSSTGVSLAPRYRLVCQHSVRSWLTSFTTLSTAFDSPVYLNLFEPDGSGAEPRRENLTDFEQLVALRSKATPGSLTVLAAGRRMDLTYGALKLYHVDADLVARVGRATAIGQLAQPSGGASELAGALGLRLRSHGGSLSGERFLVPLAGGARALGLYQEARLERVATVALEPQSHFFPLIDEEAQILSALRYDAEARRFRNVFYKIDLQSGVFGAELVRESAPSAGWTATGPAVARGTGRWWLELPLGERPAKSVMIAKLDLKTRVVSRARFEVPMGLRVFPQAGFLSGGGVALALERIELVKPVPDHAPFGQVKAAKLVMLRWNEAGLVIESELAYPRETVESIEEFGLREGPFAMRSLFASADGRELFATLARQSEAFLYRKTDLGLERVTQEACLWPDVVTVQVP